MDEVEIESLLHSDAEVVAAALESLDANVRDAIVTAFYGRLTHRDVAELRGIPEGTVKTRIRLGLRQLREILRPSDIASA